MGEARRRRLAGQSPVESYRVPPGRFAITIDIAGHNPSTVSLEAEKITELMRRAHALWPKTMSFPTLVNGLAERFADDPDNAGAAIGIATTALYHPQQGAAIRQAVSQALAVNGKAHLTWNYNPRHGLAMAVGEHFVDLDKPLAAATEPVVVAREDVIDWPGEVH